MRRTAELLAGAVVLAMLGYGLGTCGRVPASELATQRAQGFANGYRVAKAYASARQAHVDTVTRRVIIQSQRVDTVLVTVDSVLADSAANTETIRRTLSMLRTEVVTYRVTVDSLIMSHLAYRGATDLALAAADSTIDAYKDAVKALDCRILGVRCPSRVASFGGGMLATALLILLL